eukprot:SAG22_NODE_823_length_6993_cov_6.116913_5_plen_311_part_00
MVCGLLRAEGRGPMRADLWPPRGLVVVSTVQCAMKGREAKNKREGKSQSEPAIIISIALINGYIPGTACSNLQPCATTFYFLKKVTPVQQNSTPVQQNSTPVLREKCFYSVFLYMLYTRVLYTQMAKKGRQKGSKIRLTTISTKSCAKKFLCSDVKKESVGILEQYRKTLLNILRKRIAGEEQIGPTVELDVGALGRYHVPFICGLSAPPSTSHSPWSPDPEDFRLDLAYALYPLVGQAARMGRGGGLRFVDPDGTHGVQNKADDEYANGRCKDRHLVVACGAAGAAVQLRPPSALLLSSRDLGGSGSAI